MKLKQNLNSCMLFQKFSNKQKIKNDEISLKSFVQEKYTLHTMIIKL